MLDLDTNGRYVLYLHILSRPSLSGDWVCICVCVCVYICVGVSWCHSVCVCLVVYVCVCAAPGCLIKSITQSCRDPETHRQGNLATMLPGSCCHRNPSSTPRHRGGGVSGRFSDRTSIRLTNVTNDPSRSMTLKPSATKSVFVPRGVWQQTRWHLQPNCPNYQLASPVLDGSLTVTYQHDSWMCVWRLRSPQRAHGCVCGG